MRSVRRRLLLLAGAVIVSGCALPTDDEATLIEPETLPEVLRSNVEVTTTVDQGPRTEPVLIFLLSNEGERTIVREVSREIDRGATFEAEVGLLFPGPDVPDIRTEDEIERALFNALSGFQLTEAFVNDNQVAVIDMVPINEDGEPIDPGEIGTQILENALAQLVYTATGFPTEVPINAVRIRIAGVAEFLPTEEGDSRELLNRADFETYDPEYVPPATTAPPTTTEPEPAETAPADDEANADG
ncbi:MAG: hypothetical protein AAGC53_05900 [Actinomycetota bacterium]